MTQAGNSGARAWGLEEGRGAESRNRQDDISKPEAVKRGVGEGFGSPRMLVFFENFVHARRVWGGATVQMAVGPFAYLVGSPDACSHNHLPPPPGEAKEEPLSPPTPSSTSKL